MVPQKRKVEAEEMEGKSYEWTRAAGGPECVFWNVFHSSVKGPESRKRVQLWLRAPEP